MPILPMIYSRDVSNGRYSNLSKVLDLLCPFICLWTRLIM